MLPKYFQQRCHNERLIEQPTDPELEIIVVIPAYDEEHSIIRTLDSLNKCSLQDQYEVIVVINDRQDTPMDIKAANKRTFDLLQSRAENQSNLFPLYFKDLKHKNAGVGLARKYGMDEAARRFYSVNKKDKVIVCLDADSQVKPNYLSSIKDHFQKYHATPAADIYYEHPTDDPAFSQDILDGIIAYELHLRYYINIKKWCGLPYAFQTVGSAMAVRAEAYIKEGGMVIKRAGEDFYFLHKYTLDDDFSSIKNTMVIPSPRKSTRVPFGTGKAIIDLVENNRQLLTYSPRSFIILKSFLTLLPQIYESASLENMNLNQGLMDFLTMQKWELKLDEIKSNTVTYESFKKRFFSWFNAFICMKYLHYMRDHHHPNVAIDKACYFYFSEIKKQELVGIDPMEYLNRFRKMDRN